MSDTQKDNGQDVQHQQYQETVYMTEGYRAKKSLSDKISLMFSSMALLSDGYQALIISSVESCLATIYGNQVLTSTLATRVSNALLIGDIIGMLGFGLIIDRLGRKFGIILCTCLVCLGIILATASSGVTPTGLIWMLIISRGITGCGVGGEYPCSSVTAGEAAEESGRSRGFWLIVSGNFVIDCGFLLASIVPVILLAICGMGGLEVVWRLSIGLGLIIPVSLLFFRLKMLNSEAYRKEALKKNVPYFLIFKHYWPKLLVTGGIWFLYDFIIYTFGIFSNTILQLAVPSNSLMQTFQWNIVLNVFYPFGALAGAFVVDRIGRKYLLGGCFILQAIIGIIIGALANKIIAIFPLFVILYGIFLFLGEAGPGDVTILISAEMYPTAIRGTMFGLSAALGKAGAAIGTQVFKPILAALTESTGDDMKAQGYVFIIGSCIAILAAILSVLFVPDLTKEKMESLDEEFRQLLIDNGYDVSQLGVHDATPNFEIDDIKK